MNEEKGTREPVALSKGKALIASDGTWLPINPDNVSHVSPNEVVHDRCTVVFSDGSRREVQGSANAVGAFLFDLRPEDYYGTRASNN